MKTKSRGFTIIELLVVIAIVAILAGMLLPAMATARERTRSIACLANLKQISVGTQYYQNDNDSCFFPSEPGDTGNSWVNYFVAEKVYPNYKIFACPSSKLPRPEDRTSPLQGLYSHYGINYFHIGSSLRYSTDPIAKYLPAKMSSIRNFSSVVMVMENVIADGTQASYIVGDGLAAVAEPGKKLGFAYPAHIKRNFNVLWSDGHGSNLLAKTQDEIYSDKVLGTGVDITKPSSWKRQ